jgi:hypothetical protein
MTKRSPEEVLAVLRQAGFTPDQAITMAAISGAESGWDDANVGDVALQDQTWGPSFGLFQVRTLKDATNSGGIRDLAALSGDDLAQAKAAYAISKGGTDFSAWTDFRNGKWRDFLSPVQRVAGALANIPGKVAGQIIGKVAGAAAGDVRDLVITGLILAAGAGLVVAGAVKSVSPKLDQALQPVDKAARKVASVAAVAA